MRSYNERARYEELLKRNDRVFVSVRRGGGGVRASARWRRSARIIKSIAAAPLDRAQARLEFPQPLDIHRFQTNPRVSTRVPSIQRRDGVLHVASFAIHEIGDGDARRARRAAHAIHQDASRRAGFVGASRARVEVSQYLHRR